MPADLGPPFAPITPSVARVTLISGDSNHSSSKIGGALCEDFDEPVDLARPELAEAREQLQVFDEVSGLARRQLGRRHKQQRLDNNCQALEVSLIPRERLRIALRKLRDFGEGLALSCQKKRWRPSG